MGSNHIRTLERFYSEDELRILSNCHVTEIDECQLNGTKFWVAVENYRHAVTGKIDLRISFTDGCRIDEEIYQGSHPIKDINTKIAERIRASAFYPK